MTKRDIVELCEVEAMCDATIASDIIDCLIKHGIIDISFNGLNLQPNQEHNYIEVEV